MKNLNIKYLSMLTFVVGILHGCSVVKTDELALCKEFYELNKNEPLGEFSNLFIEVRNIDFDSKINKYQTKFYMIGIYDSSKLNYIKIPVLESNFTQDKRVNAIKRCDENCINFLRREYKISNDSELSIALENFTYKTTKMYNNIKLPKLYQYSNVLEVHGKPFFGIIIFKLTDNALVYYILNTKLFDKGHLPNNAIKLDNSWYYSLEKNNDKVR